jgi:broad specificity phosphatase PhoE
MNNKLSTIYIIRHGESEVNAKVKNDNRTPRIAESPLTEKGHAQAKQLAINFKSIHIDEVFSSPLIRAKQTAEYVAMDKKLAVMTRDNLKERVRGNLNGQDEFELRKTVKYLFGDPNALTDKEMWDWKLYVDMESAEETLSRFLTELREISVAYAGKTIMVITHGNVMRGLLVHFGEGTFKEFVENTVGNTGYIRLESDGVDFFLKETNNISKKTLEGNEE